MKIVEFLQITPKWPRKARERAEGIWNLEKNKHLRGAIEKCLRTRRAVFHQVPGGNLYRVLPSYPLIPSAMKDPKLKNVMKIRITVFSPAWGLGVEAEPKDDLVPTVATLARKKPSRPGKKPAPRAQAARRKA